MSLPTFTSATTAEEVAAVFADQIRGKNVLITGTSINGIGFEAARVLAKYANLVIITGYNPERLQLSEEAIKKELPGANIRRLILDLSSLAAVRKAAAEVNAYPEPLHVLVHNAAASGLLKFTADGFENYIATDHIGPFLLTKLLAPKLLAARSQSYTPRVVVVSGAHAYGSVDFATLVHPDPKNFNAKAANARAKACNILFANELAKRGAGMINAYSLHPGVIYTNIVQKEDNKEALIAMGVLTANGGRNTEKFSWKTLGQGAATTVVAAFDTRLDAKSGAYLEDGVEAKCAPHCADQETAAKLWTFTEEYMFSNFNRIYG
ncbi:hypothetical protein K438DRAFT_1926770 [Mycena galopus ATCC 62051]|nr:hypothetical protein K438DRAFT_1926770 [Mycena galopus ATCC 62051]